MPTTTASIREPMPTGALRGALQPDGTVLWYMPGDTLPPDPVPSLADVKAARIAAINAECDRRILARWPLPKQNSAILGLYGQAELDAMTAWIDSHIAASNVACSAVFDVPAGANAISQVEAVTVAWPV